MNHLRVVKVSFMVTSLTACLGLSSFSHATVTELTSNFGEPFKASPNDIQKRMGFEPGLTYTEGTETFEAKENGKKKVLSLKKANNFLKKNKCEAKVDQDYFLVPFLGKTDPEILIYTHWDECEHPGILHSATIYSKISGKYRPLYDFPGETYGGTLVEDIRDMNGDKHPDVMICAYEGGNGAPPTCSIIGSDGEKIFALPFPSYDSGALNLYDIDQKTVIVDYKKSDDTGRVDWPEINVWDGKSFVEESKQFPEFYREVLIPNLKKEIEKAPSDKEQEENGDQDSKWPSSEEYEQALAKAVKLSAKTPPVKR